MSEKPQRVRYSNEITLGHVVQAASIGVPLLAAVWFLATTLGTFDKRLSGVEIKLEAAIELNTRMDDLTEDVHQMQLLMAREGL